MLVIGVEPKQLNPWRVWLDAARREEVDRAIRSLYAELDAAVAGRRPVCNASGRCCRFDEYGHRLYVTGLEIAWFLMGVGGSDLGVGEEHTGLKDQGVRLEQLAPIPKPQNQTPHCAYQINGLCSTHAVRPLGCRVFFCERGTEAWQQDTTERFLDRLKSLHTGHSLPYAYMEWRAGLSEAAAHLHAGRVR